MSQDYTLEASLCAPPLFLSMNIADISDHPDSLTYMQYLQDRVVNLNIQFLICVRGPLLWACGVRATFDLAEPDQSELD